MRGGAPLVPITNPFNDDKIYEEYGIFVMHGHADVTWRPRTGQWVWTAKTPSRRNTAMSSSLRDTPLPLLISHTLSHNLIMSSLPKIRDSAS